MQLQFPNEILNLIKIYNCNSKLLLFAILMAKILQFKNFIKNCKGFFADRGREGDAGRHCTGTDSNIDEEEKEEKKAGNKKRRGEERTREAGEKDGGRGKVRGGKEQASRKDERGEEERPANGGRDSNTKKGERGGGGTGEEREGSAHCPKNEREGCTS